MAAADADRGRLPGRRGTPQRAAVGRRRSGSTSGSALAIVVIRVRVPGPPRRRRRRAGAAPPARRSRCPTGRWASGCSGRSPQESLLAGLYDGLRLATIVICVGAANSLANPKRLLRSVPPALYEIGSALVVAVTVLPQLADSLRRVRAAQSAARRRRRGRVRGAAAARSCPCSRTPSSARSRWPPAWTPAATAGRPAPRARERRTTGGADARRACARSASGSTRALDRTDAAPGSGSPMLVVGVVAVARSPCVGPDAGSAARATGPAPWRWPEAVVAASGMLVGAVGLVDVAPPAARSPTPP